MSITREDIKQAIEDTMAFEEYADNPLDVCVELALEHLSEEFSSEEVYDGEKSDWINDEAFKLAEEYYEEHGLNKDGSQWENK